MGKHSIPGPDDTPREPFQATAGPEPETARYEAEEPFEAPQGPPRPEDEYPSGRFADGTWQGGHRSTDSKRRGVSIGVIVALVAVVAIVGGVILWRFLHNVLSHRSDTAAAACSGSDVPVAVIADPSIAGKITEFADRYNKSADPVGDHCVKLGVEAADSDQVIDGFAGNWPSDLGQRPALWIPASSVSTARLQAAGPKTITDSRSLVTSPVLLAVKPQLKSALAEQNWGTLPGLQTDPGSLEAMNLPGWGSLRLAVPTDGDGDASYLAAEAVAAASAPPDSPPTAGLGAVNSLIGGQPKLANPSLSTAMDALTAGGDPAAAPVHAVVITEQQLYQRSTEISGAKDVVASWLPPGPAAVADYPMASLSGDWLSEEQVTAASEFKKFLQKPEQQADLTKAGFRAENQPPPDSDVTGFPPLSATLSIPDDDRVTLANAVTAPASGGAVTILLDQSMPEQEGGESRLANVVAALRNRLQGLPPNAVVGLWTFDGVEGRTEVAAGPLSDQVNGQPRSAALAAALDKQYSSNGGAVSFTTLRLLYDGAVANFRPGVKNSVLVITAGPHTDQTLDSAGLQDYVRSAFDPARPVAINVIDFGADPDRSAWESVAQATGGSYRNLSTSDSPDLTAAVSGNLG
ncbi:MAG: substrate-binding domain-containing protein [Mycobacterium sp.]